MRYGLSGLRGQASCSCSLAPLATLSDSRDSWAIWRVRGGGILASSEDTQ
jgi:hypothetical protein